MNSVATLASRLALITTGLLLVATVPALAKDVAPYDFPITDAITATVLGTPATQTDALTRPGPIRERTFYLDLHKPGLENYKTQLRRGVDKLELSLAYQQGPAPLVVSIAGTGGSHDSGKAQMVKRMLYRSGFHVLSLTSPTNPDWIFAASSTNHTGMTPRDVEDLYRVLQQALALVKKRIQITDIHLTGYSLGGLHSAFLAKLDKERGLVGFDRVLLVNPPVNLYTSVSNLDNIAHFEAPSYKTTSELFNPIFVRLADYVKRTGKIDLTGDALYAIAEGVELTEFELRALIRVAFGLSTADIVFTTDAMNDYGYVVAPGDVVNYRGQDTTNWFKRSLSWRFLDYFYLMVLPAWQKEHPDDTEEDAIRQWSLLGIEDYLRNADNVMVQHNENDIILGPGDIDFLEDVFGERALIYPTGGHCGNMDYPRNVNDMVSFLKGKRQ